MPDTDPRDVTDLPLQPTGSGVADTEIAMMQAAVADAADPDVAPRDADDASDATGA